jgi:hypothetical protein
MLDRKNMLLACVAYLKEHPEEILRAARHAGQLRFGVPIAALRWLVAQLGEASRAKDVEIEAAPPGLRITASVEEMGTWLRGSAVVSVTDVRLSERELRVEIALSGVSIRLLDDSVNTPLAALIKSGALDVSRIAHLVANMPKRPPILVEANEDRLLLDFMRSPRIASDDSARRLVGWLSSLLSIRQIESDGTHLDLALKAFPNGLAAFLGLR